MDSGDAAKGELQLVGGAPSGGHLVQSVSGAITSQGTVIAWHGQVAECEARLGAR